MSELANPVRERQALLLGAAAVALFALYLLAIDQGHLLALVQGKIAFDENLIHEFVHDARHVAAFPCH